jgi:hypothetical protein
MDPIITHKRVSIINKMVSLIIDIYIYIYKVGLGFFFFF